MLNFHDLVTRRFLEGFVVLQHVDFFENCEHTTFASQNRACRTSQHHSLFASEMAVRWIASKRGQMANAPFAFSLGHPLLHLNFSVVILPGMRDTFSTVSPERERDRTSTTPSPGHIKDHELKAIRLSAHTNIKNKKEDGSRGPTC